MKGQGAIKGYVSYVHNCMTVRDYPLQQFDHSMTTWGDLNGIDLL